MNRHPEFPVTRHLVEQRVLAGDPFTLIDVGCYGGIHRRWRTFEDCLRAYAIDPATDEIRRLQEEETNPDVRYWSGYIGLPADHPVVVSRASQGPWGNNPWSRLSAAWGVEILSKTRESLNDEEDQEMSKAVAGSPVRTDLTRFARERQIESVDFIKVDVDGEDLYVLLGGEDLINDTQPLGFELEVNFFGTDCETDHTLHNIDRLMRRHGYELFDLSVKRFSRRALPAPFIYDLIAEATWGAPVQGDAFYARDVVGQSNRSDSFSISDTGLLKMVAVHELFGLPDCAAEILVTFKERLAEIVDVGHLLDLLTPPFNGEMMTYQQYCQTYADDPTKFYPPHSEVPQPQITNTFRGKIGRALRRLINSSRARF